MIVREREGGNLERRGVHWLTSCSSSPPSLLPSPVRRGAAAPMTLSGGPEHRSPSPSDTHGLPRHSGSGERQREWGGCYHQGDSLNFLPLAQIAADFHHNTLSKPAL